MIMLWVRQGLFPAFTMERLHPKSGSKFAKCHPHASQGRPAENRVVLKIHRRQSDAFASASHPKFIYWPGSPPWPPAHNNKHEHEFKHPGSWPTR